MLAEPDLMSYDEIEDNINDRHGWSPVDYVVQYLDEELSKTISDCTNDMSISRSGKSIESSTQEIFRFFGASVYITGVPYPQIHMYWAHDTRSVSDAITDMASRRIFFNLKGYLKSGIDGDVTKQAKADDVLLKDRPVVERVRQGCLKIHRPQCISIDEQMIPFSGSCPFRHYISNKPNPIEIKNFVMALSIYLTYCACS